MFELNYPSQNSSCMPDNVSALWLNDCTTLYHYKSLNINQCQILSISVSIFHFTTKSHIKDFSNYLVVWWWMSNVVNFHISWNLLSLSHRPDRIPVVAFIIINLLRIRSTVMFSSSILGLVLGNEFPQT